MEYTNNKLYKIFCLSILFFLCFLSYSYTDSFDSSIKRKVWFDYDKRITIDDICINSASEFLNNDNKYLTENKHNLKVKNLNNEIKDLNEELNNLIENAYVKSYIDKNGDFKKIKNGTRIYPNDISNYILSLKIAINNREVLKEMIFSFEDLNEFIYDKYTCIDSDTLLDTDNLSIKENEKVLFFVIDNLENDSIVPKNILNSLDIFISPIIVEDDSVLGLYLTDIYQSNEPRSTIFLSEGFYAIESLKDSLYKEEKKSSKFKNLYDIQKKDFYFNLGYGLTLYHEIGHVLLQKYINNTYNLDNIDDIELMEKSSYHDLYIDIVDDFKSVCDMDFTNQYENSFEEYFADYYSYYSYYKDGKNPDLYNILNITFNNYKEINLFFDKYSKRIEQFEELPSFTFKINNIDTNHNLFKHSTYVVNKRFNLNLENKTNNSYTILFEKERNFLQILLGINSKITKITINPNESYNEELKLSKGEYYISYVYNDILDAYYTKLVIQ